MSAIVEMLFRTRMGKFPKFPWGKYERVGGFIAQERGIYIYAA